MNIKTQKHQRCCIFDFDGEELTKSDLEQINIHLEKNSHRRFIVNLGKVKKIDKGFFELMGNKKLVICGVNLDILTYFSLRNTINSVPIYLDVDDFLKDKRRLISRKFQVA